MDAPSQPAAAASAAQQPTSFLTITFRLLVEAPPSSSTVRIVGDHPALGSWAPANAITLSQTTTRIPGVLTTWSVAVTFQQRPERLLYKFIIVCNNGECQWEAGSNRLLLLRDRFSRRDPTVLVHIWNEDQHRERDFNNQRTVPTAWATDERLFRSFPFCRPGGVPTRQQFISLLIPPTADPPEHLSMSRSLLTTQRSAHHRSPRINVQNSGGTWELAIAKVGNDKCISSPDEDNPAHSEVKFPIEKNAKKKFAGDLADLLENPLQENCYL